MIQITRFDPSCLSDEDADAHADAPELSSQGAILDVAEELCTAAANNNGLLPAATPSILKFLKDKGLVQQQSTGEAILLHSCLDYGIACQKPILESKTRNQKTILEIEQRMTAEGWEFVDKHKQASVQERKAARNNFQTYYDLLLKCAEQVNDLESDGHFHHKQSERYYQAVHQSIVSTRDEEFLVSPYKTAEYYSQVIAFLQGAIRCI